MHLNTVESDAGCIIFKPFLHVNKNTFYLTILELQRQFSSGAFNSTDAICFFSVVRPVASEQKAP